MADWKDQGKVFWTKLRSFTATLFSVISIILFLLRTIFHRCYAAVIYKRHGCGDIDCWIKSMVTLLFPAMRHECSVVRSITYHRILFRLKADVADVSRREDFVTKFERVANASILLDSNVVLYTLSPTHAIFVETKKSRDCYTANNAAFMWWNLYFDAVCVIQVPICTFHEAAEQYFPHFDFSKVAFLYNYGRCGSTLVGKALEAASMSVVAYSEPDPITYLLHLKHIYGKDYDWLKQALSSSLKFLCQPLHHASASNSSTVYVIKPKFTAIIFANDLYKMFPECKFLFLSRNALDVVKSYEKTFQQRSLFHMLRILFVFQKLSMKLVKKAIGLSFLCDEQEFDLASKYLHGTTFETAVRLWCYMQKFRANLRDIPFFELSFENFVKQPIVICSEICDFLNIPMQNALSETKMRNVLKVDSQDGTVMSQAATKNNVCEPITPELRARVSSYLSNQGLSSLWSQ